LLHSKFAFSCIPSVVYILTCIKCKSISQNWKQSFKWGKPIHRLLSWRTYNWFFLFPLTLMINLNHHIYTLFWRYML